MSVAKATFTVLLAIATLVPGHAMSQPLERAWPKPGSEPRLSGTIVTWPAAGQRQLVVLESPTGDQLREVFDVGEQAVLDLADLPASPDGTYQYNHRLLPMEGETSQVLSGGSLRVRGGLLQPPTPEGVAKAAQPHKVSQPLLIERGESPLLWFVDTSQRSDGTDDDWMLRTDFFGGEEFAINWLPDHGPSQRFTSPFRIERGANDYSLYVDAEAGYSEIGVNTNTPARTLHLLDSFRPSLRFEDAGLSTRTWDLVAASSSFRLVDVTDSTVPVLVEARAPNNALYVRSNGSIGLGTPQPQGSLHIFGQPDADVFSGIGPNLAQGPAFNFGYSGGSYGLGSGFFNARQAAGAVAPNPALYFMTNSIERMLIDRDGDIAVDMDGAFGNTFDPQHPIHAQQSGAYLSASGVWRDASSRALKENIQPLAIETALAALTTLEPVQFNYKADPEDALVGFIAEDVPDLVATPDRKTLAPTDIVGVLTKVVQEQQRRLGEQQHELRSLRREVADLRSQID